MVSVEMARKERERNGTEVKNRVSGWTTLFFKKNALTYWKKYLVVIIKRNKSRIINSNTTQ